MPPQHPGRSNMAEATNGESVPQYYLCGPSVGLPGSEVGDLRDADLGPDGYARYEAANIPAQTEESLGQQPGACWACVFPGKAPAG